MITREQIKREIEEIADEALEDIWKYLILQKFYYSKTSENNSLNSSESQLAMPSDDLKKFKNIISKRL